MVSFFQNHVRKVWFRCGLLVLLNPLAVLAFGNGRPKATGTTTMGRRHLHFHRLGSTKLRPVPTSTTAATTAAAAAATTATITPSTTKWFPTRIQEDVDYTSLVQSLYLRHIVVETIETAQLALEQYLADTASRDPFGDLAAKLSACTESRKEAGKVGWIDLDRLHDTLSSSSSSSWPSPLLPRNVFQQLVELSPKTGDVHILHSEMTQQVHIVRVDELLIQHHPNLVSKDDQKHTRVGAHTGRNAILSRSKLKGQGVMPKLPDLSSMTPKSKSYFIQTNGCQMNVADSERLAGILENELQLTLATRPEQADVVLFNTCSIRDHAEQKLYDLLGPYCARKRKGEEIALIVTGCVAQQEGEALLRKIPEVDVVLGPQYVPFLSNVLEQIEWGNQLVATAPILYKEDDPLAKPIRGHSVRGFVNTIFGCNEHCVSTEARRRLLLADILNFTSLQSLVDVLCCSFDTRIRTISTDGKHLEGMSGHGRARIPRDYIVGTKYRCLWPRYDSTALLFPTFGVFGFQSTRQDANPLYHVASAVHVQQGY